MTTIAIDLGASFFKAAKFRGDSIVKSVRVESPPCPHSDSVLEIVQIPVLVDLIRKTLTDLMYGENEVRLCICNEMHGFILSFDDGTPFTDYISWQKELGAVPLNGKSSIDLLKKDKSLLKSIEKTGMPLRSGLPSSNLFYLFRSGLLDKTDNKLFFYTLGSYIIKALFGVDVNEHPTNAAATGLYNIVKEDWDNDLVSSVCSNKVIFPNISDKPLSSEFNRTKVTIYPAIGDQQAALLGAGFKNDNDISFNLGTGAQVSVLLNTPVFGDGYQVRPYFFGKYLKTVPHIPSGRALNVYFRFVKDILNTFNSDIKDEDIWNTILTLIQDNSESSLKIDMSFFENAIKKHTKGSISDIDEYSFTLKNLFQSAVDQIGNNCLEISERICLKDATIENVIFSGGVAKKFQRIQNRIMSNFPNATICVSDNETLIGLFKYSSEI